MTTADHPELVEISFVDLSLDAVRFAQEHHDELFREFSLLMAREPSPGHSVPSRLTELIEELDRRFSGFTAGTQSELNAALNSDRRTVTLVYRVPREIKDAVLEFADLLAEADEYCRQGELLTLAPPPEAVRFRDWYLGEFVRQIDGLPPTPWVDASEGAESN